MDVAFVSEVSEGQIAFRSLEGDAHSFRFREGVGSPLVTAFCRRVIEGRVPHVVPDVGEDAEVRDLEMTRVSNIGSYVGVPLQFSDGRLFGTVCCMSHSPHPELRERDAGFMGVIARLIAEHIEREELEAKNRELEIKATGVGALLAALEARDGYTGNHSQAVVRLSVAVAHRMGLSEKDVTEIEQAALLHDVGKIGMSDSVLYKPGPLGGGERELMQEHPIIGERIVAAIEGLTHLAPVIRAEHERWDGKGYPDGLSGEQIPLASRVVFACDSFHAMTSDRPYRKAMGVRTALEELQRNSRTQFDPGVVETLLDVVGDARSET
jgi:HD-GYP domain-containing protein (c-di-GMP phosphodiesterase class II)